MFSDYRLLLDLMTKRERATFWTFVGANFILSLLEAASVVSIFPFLSLLSRPDLIETNKYYSFLFNHLQFERVEDFVFYFGVAVFVFTVLGILSKMLTIWLGTRFALKRSYSFSTRLLSLYLSQPYDRFLSKNSSSIGSSVLLEIDRVVAEGLLPAVRVISDLFSVVLLVSVLIIIQPEIAFYSAFALVGSYLVIFYLVRRAMVVLGRDRLEANQVKFRVVREATEGLKELKLLGLRDSYMSRFSSASLRLVRVQTRAQVILNLPRHLIELIAFGGAIALVLVLMSRADFEAGLVVPTLGFLAAVGVKLLPALQNVYLRITSLRQVRVPLSKLNDDFRILERDLISGRVDESKKIESVASGIRFSDVSYSYPGSETPSLFSLNVSIPANTTVGLVGDTGAGKTTFVDVLLGLLQPITGRLVVDDIEVDQGNLESWQKLIGYVPQSIFLTDSTVYENIAFGIRKDLISLSAVERAAKLASIHDFVVESLPDGYDTVIGERGLRLSGGQRQRIGIARALYNDPPVLVFDEATSALDNNTEQAILDAVGRVSGQKTIVMVTHRLSTVRHADSIIVMKNGRVVESGSYDQLMDKEGEFRRLNGPRQ